MSSIIHLVVRFFGSLVPRKLSASDRDWVASLLLPQELQLWAKMHRADAVESVAVARRADAALPGDDPRRGDVLAAALLHDVGKLDSELGTYGRAVATLAGRIAGRSMANAWTHSRGFTRRCGLYLQHAERGGVRIRLAGGREAAAAWAVAHHDPEMWASVPLSEHQCRVLAQADGERVV